MAEVLCLAEERAVREWQKTPQLATFIDDPDNRAFMLGLLRACIADERTNGPLNDGAKRDE